MASAPGALLPRPKSQARPWPRRPQNLEEGKWLGPARPSRLSPSSSPSLQVIPVVGRRYPDEIFSALRGAGCLGPVGPKPCKLSKIADADAAVEDLFPDPASQLLELRCCIPVAERGALACEQNSTAEPFGMGTGLQQKHNTRRRAESQPKIS